MAGIIHMKFSNWIKWPNREDKLNDLKYPGVYVIVYNKQDMNDTSFAWIEEIIYVGMTNSKKGLKRRLRQFENTIFGKEGHGGAKRARYKYKDYEKLIKYLYVAVRPFKCDVNSNKEKDLLIMGKVTEYEYICFAEYVKRFGMLPEFNDKKRSPKK